MSAAISWKLVAEAICEAYGLSVTARRFSLRRMANGRRIFLIGWAVLPLLLVADASDSAMRRTEDPSDEISVGSGTVRVDEPHLKLPEGDRPLDTAFYLKGRRGVTLGFKGSKILFHGKVQPFLLDGCQDVTIRNVTICHARSPFSEGRIVELGSRRIKLAVGAEFPYEVRDGELVFRGEGCKGQSLLIQ